MGILISRMAALRKPFSSKLGILVPSFRSGIAQIQNLNGDPLMHLVIYRRLGLAVDLARTRIPIVTIRWIANPSFDHATGEKPPIGNLCMMFAEA